MAQNVQVYKFSEVIFSIATIPVEDIPEDGEIRVTYDRERITKQNDVNTGGIYSWRHAKPARIEVPILPHSNWVAWLQNYRNQGKMIPIALEDRNAYNSRGKFICPKAMIQDAEVVYGADAQAQTFIFECIHLDDAYAPVDLVPTTTL